MSNASLDFACAQQLYNVTAYSQDGKSSVVSRAVTLDGAVAFARGFNRANHSSAAVIEAVRPSELALPVRLPDQMTISDFAADRSLTDAIECWFSGFDDDEIDAIYSKAEQLAKAARGEALCDCEAKLGAFGRLCIWRKLIGF